MVGFWCTGRDGFSSHLTLQKTNIDPKNGFLRGTSGFNLFLGMLDVQPLVFGIWGVAVYFREVRWWVKYHTLAQRLRDEHHTFFQDAKSEADKLSILTPVGDKQRDHFHYPPVKLTWE